MNNSQNEQGSAHVYGYTVLTEMRRMLTPLRIAIYLICCAYPFVYLAAVKDDYSIQDWLDLFSFLLDGLPAIGFAIAAAAVCGGASAEGFNHRFFAYERIRMPLRRLLQVKLKANMLLTFMAFTIFILLCFVAAYVVIPYFGWVKLEPFGTVLRSGMTPEQEQIGRYGMTQLLEYGPWVYGIAYSCWVGINAAVYAALAFGLLILLNRSFIALALPFLLYTVGSFLMPDRRLYFFYSVFPFGSIQQPIWVMTIPLIFILLICAALLLVIGKGHARLDRLS